MAQWGYPVVKYVNKLTWKRSWIRFIFKVIWEWLKGSPSPLFSQGVHLIHGVSGSGKTLLMNIIMRSILQKDGFAWSNIDEFMHDRVRTFELDDLFEHGKQIKKLNKYITDKDGKRHRCKLVIIDEINQKFNKRMNRSQEYNDKFIPLISMIVVHRHVLTDRVYLIGQSFMMQDGQLQTIMKLRHEVNASKRWRYYWFRELDKFLYLPKHLKVIHYKNAGIDNNGVIIWEKMFVASKIKVDPIHLLTYDTHAFAKLTEKLPEYLG